MKRCVLCGNGAQTACLATPDTTPEACRKRGAISNKKLRWKKFEPILGRLDLTKLPKDTRDKGLDLVRPVWRQKQQGIMLLWQITDQFDHAILSLEGQGITGIANPFALSEKAKMKLLGEYKYIPVNFQAMPEREVPHYMARVRNWGTRKAIGLELCIHMQVRSDDMLGAKWSQINWSARTLTVANETRKGGTRPVPLTNYTYERFRQMALEDGRNPPENPKLPDASIFFKKGKVIYDTGNRSMAKFARSIMGQNHRVRIKSGSPDYDFTVHGFRSVGRDWGSHHKNPEFKEHILERCLGHKVGTFSQQAYQRHSYLEEQREVLEYWDGFLLSGKLEPGEIVHPTAGTEPISGDFALLDEMHRMFLANKDLMLWHAALKVAPRAEWRGRADGRKANPDRIAKMWGDDAAEADRLFVKAKRLYQKYGRIYGYHGKQRSDLMRTPGTYSIPEAAELLRALGTSVSVGVLYNAITRTPHPKIKATKSRNGVYEIPLTELQRVYPEIMPPPEVPQAAE
jgi:integrase